MVLDNIEPLPDVLSLLREILDTASGIKLLATSRERLKLKDEWTFPLDGLTFPDIDFSDSLENYSAAQLFLQSASRIYPGYAPTVADREAIARICRLTEGMPLALELAATWIRMLSPAEIADELQHNLALLGSESYAPYDQQRNIHTVFESSWDKLNPEEQRVFQRLSVFHGGFRTEAAHAVTGATLPILASLVDKSLVRGSPSGRYTMHELLRQYAAEKLSQSPQEETAVREKHCDYYAAFLGESEAGLKGTEQVSFLRELDAESQNARAAWLWAVAKGKQEALHQALDALTIGLDIRGRQHEGEELLAAAISQSEDNPLLLARLLSRRAECLRVIGQKSSARDLLVRSQTLLETLDNPKELAFTLLILAKTLIDIGDIEQARRAAGRSLKLHQALQDGWGEADCLYTMGFADHMAGSFKSAVDFYSASMTRFDMLGDKRRLLRARTNLGLMLYTVAEHAESQRMLESSVTLAEEIGDRRWGAVAYSYLGYVLKWGLKNYGLARRCYEDSLALSRSIGDQPLSALTLNSLGDLSLELEESDAGETYYRESLTICQRMNDQRGIAVARLGLASVAYARQQYDRCEGYLQPALKTFIDIQSSSYIFSAFYTWSCVLEAAGEFDLLGALLALIIHYPTVNPTTRQLAVNMVEKVADHLAVPAETLVSEREQVVVLIHEQRSTLSHRLDVPEAYIDELLAAMDDSAPTQSPLIEPLTARERDVLKLLGQGCTNQEIAARLVLGVGTIKTHTLNIYRKLGVNNRTQAVQQAHQLGLL